MKRSVIFQLAVMLFFTFSLFSQNWINITGQPIVEMGQRDIIPQKYKVYSIEDDAIKSILWSAPHEKNVEVKNSTCQVCIPIRDNELSCFSIVQYDMMEADLAKKYPHIKTFYGISIANPLHRIRIDYTEQGFRAVINLVNDKIFIDHYQRNDKNTRIWYYKQDYSSSQSWGCGYDASIHGLQKEKSTNRGILLGDCQLRSYRLANATTGEYSNFHGASNSSQSGLVLSAVTTVINRVNEVYEYDVAVRLILIANTDLLFFYNPNTDPYTNNNGGTMLNQNINTCNSVIGFANYDIGHVFSTGGGGVAFLGSVCGTSKAGGVTGQPTPVGDPFSIDYVAHEMGHQYGGNHTQFNNCNRNNSTAMEPGSASSIMGYAGICSPNVQNNSDAHFHAVNIGEIKSFLTGNGNNCATIVPNTSNQAPVANNQTNYTIPRSTPFELILDGTDPDGDPLTYQWDQMNGYSSNQTMPPASTNTSGPVFRTYLPTDSPTRSFPPLSAVLNGQTSTTWEVVPSVGRTMNFKGLLRDFNGTFGCNDDIDVNVTTNASAGPFNITSFNTPITWTEGSSQTITWNVASTNVSPINCSHVDILLSLDGGENFSILAANTPNDGSHTIIVPNGTTSSGRIKIKAVGNIFYDINNASITIDPQPANFNLSLTPNQINTCAGNDLVTTVSVTAIGGFNNSVTLSITNLPGGAIASFGQNQLLPGESTSLTISGITIASGVITVQGTSGSLSKNVNLSYSFDPLPGIVSLNTPANNAANIAIEEPSITWLASSNANQYQCQISFDQSFVYTFRDLFTSGLSVQIDSLLPGNTDIYWRVRSSNACGTSSWSTTHKFTTQPCWLYQPDDLPIVISSSSINQITSHLSVKDRGIINDLNIIDLEGNHTNIVELYMSLRSPQNTEVDFWNAICGNRGFENFDINFSDGAASPYPCPPTDGQTYAPDQNLSIFNGENMAGNWSLIVNDSEDSNGGSLEMWKIKSCATSFCRLEVDHARSNGPGSLLQAISCAIDGDTIRFNSIVNGDTIIIESPLNIDKDIVILAEDGQNIYLSTSISPMIVNNSSSNKNLELKGVKLLYAGQPSQTIIQNNGHLVLDNVHIYQNGIVTEGIIKNEANGTITIKNSVELHKNN